MTWNFYKYGENGFAEVSKNKVRYRSENNFGLSKQLCMTFEHDERYYKKF